MEEIFSVAECFFFFLLTAHLGFQKSFSFTVNESKINYFAVVKTVKIILLNVIAVTKVAKQYVGIFNRELKVTWVSLKNLSSLKFQVYFLNFHSLSLI